MQQLMKDDPKPHLKGLIEIEIVTKAETKMLKKFNELSVALRNKYTYS